MRWTLASLLVLASACRERRHAPEAVLPAPEESAKAPVKPSFTRVVEKVFERGLFARPNHLILVDGDRRSWVLDLGTGTLTRVQPVDGPREAVPFGWAGHVGWWRPPDSAERQPITMLGATKDIEAPRPLGTVRAFALQPAVDATEVFVARSDLNYSAFTVADAELVAFDRVKGSRRVLVKAPELTSFGIDATDVYWLDGLHDSTLYRLPKTGGASAVFGRPGTQGAIRVLRTKVIHVDSSGATQIADKKDGHFAKASVDLRETYPDWDDVGACWITRPYSCDDAGACSTDRERFEPRYSCWNGTAPPVVVPLPQAPTWLAISPTSVFFGTTSGVFRGVRGT